MAAAEDLPAELLFVDLETTGANALYDRITEIGIVRVSGEGVREEWSTLVNPERHIPDYIASFTGISDAMVANAPRFADIARIVLDKLQGAVFAAHNARFDYSFLRSEFRKAGIAFRAPVLCTVKLSRRLFPEHPRHNLDAIIERHGLTCVARHRALGDAKVITEFWLQLRRQIAPVVLANAVHAALGLHKLPPHLPADLIDELPEARGAYRLFAADGSLLYVGRADSLRATVCAQLAVDNPVAFDRRLAERVRHVDWVTSCGTLGAMLRQAAWIRSGAPMHNRRVRETGEPHTLRVDAASHAVKALPVSALGIDDLMQCYGVFHSPNEARKTLAQIACARQLCLKVLGAEPGEGSCLAFQIGRCKGACIGREPGILHEMRTRLALASLKIKEWPFPGRIAVRERARDVAQSLPECEFHVIDRWTYLGTARSSEELEALSASDSEETFDVDVYRILVRFFANSSKLDWLDLHNPTLAS